ncbi:MAG: hypothetical protein K2M44_05505 [Clostridia bacterium]|nr:hypothetical protein [Clostridia bacterium]
MDNYDRLIATDGYVAPPDDVASRIGDNEKILWAGKPKKSAFFAARLLPMLPIVLIWLVFDGSIIGLLISNHVSIPLFVIPVISAFFALHLIPVWMWLGLCLTAPKAYKSAYYLITDKNLYIREFKRKTLVDVIPLHTLSYVYLKKSASDGTGTLRLSGSSRRKDMYAIEDAKEVKSLLQSLIDGDYEESGYDTSPKSSAASTGYRPRRGVVDLQDLDTIVEDTGDIDITDLRNKLQQRIQEARAATEDNASTMLKEQAKILNPSPKSDSNDDTVIDKDEFDKLFSDDYDD